MIRESREEVVTGQAQGTQLHGLFFIIPVILLIESAKHITLRLLQFE